LGPSDHADLCRPPLITLPVGTT